MIFMGIFVFKVIVFSEKNRIKNFVARKNQKNAHELNYIKWTGYNINHIDNREYEYYIMKIKFGKSNFYTKNELFCY